jgi:hypothetical protein
MKVQCERRTAIRGVAGILLGLALVVPSAQAAEGLGHFPAGAQTSYAAFMPPPGETWFYGYALYFGSNSLRDDRRERIPGVDAEVFALAPRIMHSWQQPWAGWKLSSGLVMLGIHAEVEAGGQRSEATGVGMFGIEPLYLTRSFGPHWHVLTGGILYFGIGDYDRNELANYTINYDSYAYQASVTWTPTPNWEASLNYAVEFKEKNKDTQYKSGDQGSLTFGVGHRPFADKRWDLGLSGYYSHQLEDDKQNGLTVGDGNRTRRFGIGPKLVFSINPSAVLVFQWHNESNVRNALRGDLFWVECAIRI